MDQAACAEGTSRPFSAYLHLVDAMAPSGAPNGGDESMTEADEKVVEQVIEDATRAMLRSLRDSGLGVDEIALERAVGVARAAAHRRLVPHHRDPEARARELVEQQVVQGLVDFLHAWRCDDNELARRRNARRRPAP
jgi:hypothetical protein